MELWLSPREIDFRLDSVIFLIRYINENKHPDQPSNYVDCSRGKRAKVPTKDWLLNKAEILLRLGQTPYKCNGIYRKGNQATTCTMRNSRCNYLACWQLNKMMGKLLILELAGTDKEFEDLDKDEQEALLFISSGQKHRHQFIYQWKAEQSNRWKAKRLKELGKEG